VTREVIMVCGNSYASMLALYECAFGYGNDRITIASIPVSVLAVMERNSRWRTGDTVTTIWQLLAAARNCGATDRRTRYLL
jgi:hypothetical protein